MPSCDADGVMSAGIRVSIKATNDVSGTRANGIAAFATGRFATIEKRAIDFSPFLIISRLFIDFFDSELIFVSCVIASCGFLIRFCCIQKEKVHPEVHLTSFRSASSHKTGPPDYDIRSRVRHRARAPRLIGLFFPSSNAPRGRTHSCLFPDL